MRVAIETYGCTMNQSDSDIIRHFIAREFKLSSVEEADIVVVNSCGVIEYTERKIIRRMIELKNAGKKVVLAGCLPRISKTALELADAVITPENLERVVEAVKSTFNGGTRFLEWQNIDKSLLPKIRCSESAIAIVSISEGCLGHCSFCATRFARGRLRSFSMEGILKEIEKALREGYKEIQLTSQDTGCYGLDKGKFLLPKLLDEISKIEGDFKVRVGMMNPHHAKRQVEQLIGAFQSEKVFKFLHIPVQSGDNKLLEDMRRDHTVEDFLEVVESFRNNFEITLATDLIVGYPTETEESFWKSYELIEEVKPDIVNITRFSKRRGTLAEKLKEIPGWIVKERSRKLTELCIRIGLENNKKFVGKNLKVLITSLGKKGMLARSDSYRAVITIGKLGESKIVKIGACRHNYLLDKELVRLNLLK